MRIIFIVLSCFFFAGADAQTRTDSTQTLNEVTVKAYFGEQSLLRSASSVSIIDTNQLNNQNDASLVQTFNTAAGVRMEARSPGSYRLSIRGSLLRSPFGIRNIKIYLDQFALTDAGGNTYLNLLDAGGISRIEILKGPEGSIFGANSGGVILIDPITGADKRLTAGISAGSYGMFHQKASLRHTAEKYHLSLNEGFQRADGYRENSALNRKYINLNQQWQYTPSAQLRSVILCSDLYYQTPGGLTALQAAENPRQARPPSGKIPGAVTQQAAIYNKTLFGGLLHEVVLTPNVKHMVAISASVTDFKNPFITNFEVRKENSFGLRTYIEVAGTGKKMPWRWNTGLESQKTYSAISNFENLAGTIGAAQSADKLAANQSFLFTHFNMNATGKLFFEAATSLNFYNYRYKSNYPAQTALKTQRFDAQLMPRLAASYQTSKHLAVRAAVSRGYSPPTIAEVRASDNLINTSLQPEAGWNYESGIRLITNRVTMDAVFFYFKLDGAIVRRVNNAGAEYFVNAGGTNQPGLETQLNVVLIPEKRSGFIRQLIAGNSFTRSAFKFRDYQNGSSNYSGNSLTGVPKQTIVSSLTTALPAKSWLYVQHNYTSAIPLADDGNALAMPYHLVQLKAGKYIALRNNRKLNIFIGADNILNAYYSLGNDLNAVGSRYFNPSAGRNYYAGISIN